MIKRYNQFIKGKLNEEFVMAPKPLTQEPEIEILPGTDKPLVEPQPPGLIPDTTEEDSPAKAYYGEEEEEGGDLYSNSINKLADMLGVTPQSGSINYQGKKITFPSETEMFHVDKKKFKTAEEVVSYLEGGDMKGEMNPNLPSKGEVDDQQAIEDLEQEFKESKSYKTTRTFRKFR